MKEPGLKGENYWNGSILERVETAIKLAENMTWKGIHPVVRLVKETYQTGVKLTKKAMKKVENQIQRLNYGEENFPNLGKWFIDICCGSS
uniref:ISAzo13-like element transposase-related protein n=1 Tax=Okeania sp. SIO2F4 TaxID=2607790 RepID=UPI0025FFDB62|nr:hypothetical protein [Okeania sp. SIO2F4]